MNKKKLTLWGIFTALGFVLYRMGGAKGYNTKFRDIGVSLASCAFLACWGGVHTLKEALSLIPWFALSWAALTTYRYFLPKPERYNFIHFGLHGFFVAFSAFPYAWASGNWLWFGVRCVICAVLVGGWSQLISNAVAEESGRGVVLVGTIPLLAW